MKKTVTIELPEEFALLVQQDPLLKKLVENIAVEAIKDKLLKLAIADQLTRDVKITEEELLEIDRRIKRSIAKNYGINNRH